MQECLVDIQEVQIAMPIITFKNQPSRVHGRNQPQRVSPVMRFP